MDDYTTSEVQKTISALSSLISSNNDIAVKNISLALSSLSKSSLKSAQDATLASMTAFCESLKKFNSIYNSQSIVLGESFATISKQANSFRNDTAQSIASLSAALMQASIYLNRPLNLNASHNSDADSKSCSVSDSAASVDDYVTVDKSIAKEIDLTGPVTISVGKCRIKVSSDLLLSFLFSLLLFLANTPFQINDSNATEEYQNEHLEAHKEQIQLQREENQLLRDFFDSIDSSSSSQSESINLLIDTLTDLLENPQVQKAAPPVPDESVDQIPGSGNSNPE